MYIPKHISPALSNVQVTTAAVIIVIIIIIIIIIMKKGYTEKLRQIGQI
jgi:hypothetical protein